MTLGIVVFGAAFLAGLGLGTYTRRPLSTAFIVLGASRRCSCWSATGEIVERSSRARHRRAARARRGQHARDVRAARRPLLTSAYPRARGRGGTGRRGGFRSCWLRLEVRVLPPALCADRSARADFLSREGQRRSLRLSIASVIQATPLREAVETEQADVVAASRRRARGRPGSRRRPEQNLKPWPEKPAPMIGVLRRRDVGRSGSARPVRARRGTS